MQTFTHVEMYIHQIQMLPLRDDAQNKMLALKEKADKELTQYNTELKEHIRVIDHSRKLKEFMSRKDHERTEAHEAMEAMRRRKDAEKSNERERTVIVSVCGGGIHYHGECVGEEWGRHYHNFISSLNRSPIR